MSGQGPGFGADRTDTVSGGGSSAFGTGAAGSLLSEALPGIMTLDHVAEHNRMLTEEPGVAAVGNHGVRTLSVPAAAWDALLRHLASYRSR